MKFTIVDPVYHSHSLSSGMQRASGVSVVPGLGRLIANPELLASIRAIVGTVTNTHLADNLLRGDLDEIATCCGRVRGGQLSEHDLCAAKVTSQHVINEKEMRGNKLDKLHAVLV